MIPEMQAQPRAAHGPHAPVRPINGRGRAPEVGVVMHHPPACAVLRLRGASASHGEVVHHSDERLDALGEVAGFGGPVVHLGVDVDGVFATPRRVRAFIPQPLQARWLAAGTRGRDEEVAAVLIVERGQLRVAAVGEVVDALVRGQFHGCALSEIKSDAAEQLLVIGLVRDV